MPADRSFLGWGGSKPRAFWGFGGFSIKTTVLAGCREVVFVPPPASIEESLALGCIDGVRTWLAPDSKLTCCNAIAGLSGLKKPRMVPIDDACISRKPGVGDGFAQGESPSLALLLVAPSARPVLWLRLRSGGNAVENSNQTRVQPDKS